MIKISFQSNKKLLKLTEILSRDIEKNCNISFRFYCEKPSLLSPSAQEHSYVSQAITLKKQNTTLEDETNSNKNPKLIINAKHSEKLKKKGKKALRSEAFRDVFQLDNDQDSQNSIKKASLNQFSKAENNNRSEKYVKPKIYNDNIYKISQHHIKLLNNDLNWTPNVSDTANTNILQNKSIGDKRVLSNTSDLLENHMFDSEHGHEKSDEEIVKSNLEIVNPESNESSFLSLQQNESFESNNNLKHPIFSRYKMLETSGGRIKYDLSSDEFNVNKFVEEFNSLPKPLDECNEDLSDFGPNFYPTFNFAAYADKSSLIQKFVDLNVKLYKVEKNQDYMRALLSVDMEKELPIYIQFLHDCGVSADSLGDVITENPMVFKEDLDDLKTRIRYLKAHDFKQESITRIITKNPKWLLWATKHIDERLGHFQNEFKLNGSEVRFLATKQPKLITYNFKKLHENTFAIREEMGFNNLETKVILLSKPRLWMNARKKIMDSFDYLHNTMELTHLTIASQADILTCRRTRLKNRHEFLMELKKVQYDSSKPGYIAPITLVSGSDAEFCSEVAKTALETYNLFLKTR